MALVVEDGTGLTTADAYVSIATADAYHLARAHTKWAAPDSDKEVAIRAATDYLDLNFKFQGLPLTDDQALAWPRTGVVDEEKESLVADDAVPVLIQRAVAELALTALTTGLDDDPSSGATRRLERSGRFTIETTFGGAGASPSFAVVQRLVRRYLAVAGGDRIERV